MLEKFLNNSKQNTDTETIESNIDKNNSESYNEQVQHYENKIKKLQKEIKDNEIEINKLSQMLSSKEKILLMQNKKLSSNEEELTGYINKIFEQQERERIVKWIVNSIRESLNITEVLNSTVIEIGKLLKADRCLIALYDDKKNKFILKGEYKAQAEIQSIIEQTDEIKILPEWQKMLIQQKLSIVVNDVEFSSQAIKETQSQDVKSFALTPVIHKGDILGLIAVQQVSSEREWKEYHIEILKYIGTQIAIAIRQASFYSDIKKQKEREQLLKNIISTIRSSLDIKEVKRLVVTETCKAFNADRCYIRLYDPNEDKFVFEDLDYDIYCKNEENKNVLFERHNSCLFTEYYKEGQVLAFDNLETFLKNMDVASSPRADYLRKLKIKTGVIVPIVSSQNILGILTINYCETNPKIDDDTIELLKTIASQLGIAIRQIQLYEDLNRRVKREATMRKIITKIRNTLDINEVLSSICEETAKLLNFDRVAIFLYKETNTINKFILGEEYQQTTKIKQSPKDGFDPRLIEYWEDIFFNKKTIISAYNVEEYDFPDFAKEYYKNSGAKSLLALPIEKEGDKCGGLFLSNHCDEKHWHEPDVQLLETIVDQLYIAIRQAHLYSESEKTNKLKSEFLASMSHEFRTPLNAIIGFSEMLATGAYGNLTAKQFEYLNNISVSGNHLLRLVNDILDLSKIESGNMEVSNEKFDTNHIINETTSILKSMAIKKNISIKLDTTSAWINSDSKRFRQIMYNLLSNAIKFTETNGCININSYLLEDKVKVEVIDNGIGISKENKKKIFNQFAQIDSSYTRKQEGTGLGLTLTKKLVELLGGDIGVDSEEGKGSIFWFCLPTE